MKETTQSVETRSPEETWRFAEEVLRRLPSGGVIALHGDLGAGKTCFVQGLAQALGVRSAVNSPTFTLINEHEGTQPLHHVDLYRIGSADEALGLGIDDLLFGGGITAIEWAERIACLLPPTTIHVTLEAGDGPEVRRITVRWGGEA